MLKAALNIRYTKRAVECKTHVQDAFESFKQNLYRNLKHVIRTLT